MSGLQDSQTGFGSGKRKGHGRELRASSVAFRRNLGAILHQVTKPEIQTLPTEGLRRPPDSDRPEQPSHTLAEWS
jgi:hypothetical protein